MLSTQQSMLHQSRHYQTGSLAARLLHLNSRNGNLSKINELILRRNFCTKPSIRSERNWTSVRKQHQQSKKEIRRLFSLAKDEKWYLIAAVGCLLVSSVVTLGVPRAIGKLMDMIVSDGFPKEKLNTFCVILFGIFVAGGLANFGRIYLMNSASKQMINLNENTQFKFIFFYFQALRIVKDLRSRLYRTMLNQEPGWYDTKGTGELINRLSNDTTLVGNSLSQNLSDGLRSIITIAAGTSMMVYTSPQLSLVAVCVVPFIGGLGNHFFGFFHQFFLFFSYFFCFLSFLAILFGTYVKNITKLLLDKLAEVMRIGEERLNNVKTVKMFCKEERENRLFTKELVNALDLGYKDIYARAAFYGIGLFYGIAYVFLNENHYSRNTNKIKINFLFNSRFIGECNNYFGAILWRFVGGIKCPNDR